MVEKACSKCGAVKPWPSGYYKNGTQGGKARYDTRCKDCMKAKASAWMRSNPEKKKAAQQRWREENRERHLGNERRWRERNRESIREYRRQWGQENPGRVARHTWVQDQKRRRGEQPNRETVGYRDLLKDDPCSYCGAPTEEIDHIVPRDEWTGPGWTQWENLTASCQFCNRSKAARPLLTFLLER